MITKTPNSSQSRHRNVASRDGSMVQKWILLGELGQGLVRRHLFNFAGARNSRAAPAKLNGAKKIENDENQFYILEKITH